MSERGNFGGVHPERRSSDALLQRAVSASLDAMAVLTPVHNDHGKIVDFIFEIYNEAAAQMIGRRPDDVVGQAVTDLFPDAADHLVALWSQTMTMAEPVVEEIETAPGRRWLRQTLVPLGDALLITSHDISDRRRAEAELEHRAFHDPLTDLPNRVLAVQRIGEAIGRAERDGRRAAVLFIDLDRFKSVNDTLGHASGDLLLQALANRLRRSVRSRDTVARFSGDEFVICLDGVASESDAMAVVEKLHANLRKPYVIADRKVVLTASVGAAMSSPGVDADSLVSRADAAAYEAKRRGRDRVAMFDESIRARALQELAVEQELRNGIAGGELRLHFQPTVDVAAATVTGVEALVRWEHPERGLLGPAEFLTVAEQTGMMGELGRWVRSAACGAMARLLDDDRIPDDFVMWVNVSSAELTTGFCDELASTLTLTGIPAERIGVDLSESTLVTDMTSTELVLERLAAMGVRIAIDDFGSGSSSLTYLQRLRADVMKMHHTFVHGLDRTASPVHDAHGAREIATAMVSFGHHLGMTVIAEGVETTGQLEELIDMGCTHVAGNLLCPAVDESELLRRFTDLTVIPGS
ncbi:MAG: putative bifunctional diguanylate cyclase/phosphodiesterase [Actinomycetes bacterium]